MTVVLVLNVGSSSVKWQLVDGQSGASIRGGLVERFDADRGEPAAHDAVIRVCLRSCATNPSRSSATVWCTAAAGSTPRR